MTRLNQTNARPARASAAASQRGDSWACPACGAERLAGTNGAGLAVLWCPQCDGREVVHPRRPPRSAPRAPAPPKVALHLSARELRRLARRIRRGETNVIAEARRLGLDTNRGELRAALRELLGDEAYQTTVREGRRAAARWRARHQGRE